MIFKNPLEKTSNSSESYERVDPQRPFSTLSHHAGKDGGGSSRVVWVRQVRRGVERSGGARGVDAVAVGSQRKGIDGLLRPGGLQRF